MTKQELILLPVLKATRGPRGGLVLTQKFFEGAAEYAKHWPGPVTTLAEVVDTPSTDMDHLEALPGEIETGLEERPKSPDALAERLKDAALAHAFLSPLEYGSFEICQRLGVPYLCTSESTPKSERQEVDAVTSNPILRIRRKYWLRWAERTRQKMLPNLAGLQCSGTPTYDLYKQRQPNALLFFDNRVWREDVISEAEMAVKTAAMSEGKPLRLIFGGRLIPMKGVRDLPKIAEEVRRRNVPFTLDIYGTGPLAPEIEQEVAQRGLGDLVRMRGALDFRTGWIPTVKRDADLFLCCHLQGDPSSTYPEVMSCGVPFAGYDNDAFTGIVRESRAGWLTPMGDPAAFADRIAKIHADRGALVDAANEARAFAIAHTFETTFARRAQHMIRSSRLPEPLKASA